jgi:hypothetical protein
METLSHDPFPPKHSPDGRIEVRFAAYEARMSHWILEPIVTRTRDGTTVLEFNGTGWDAGARAPSFPARDRVELHLRRYPEGGTFYDLIIDVEAERCWFAGADHEASTTAEAEALLEVAYQRQVERTAPDYLAQGLCPNCKGQLYGGWLHWLRGRTTVKCEVCGRTWQLPPGAKLH